MEVTAIKTDKKIWDDLLYKSENREELASRRKESLDRREEYERKHREQLTQMRIEHDRLATNERVKQDDHVRETINVRRKKEKDEALDIIYGKDGNLMDIKDTNDDMKYIREGDRELDDDVEVNKENIVTFFWIFEIY